MDMNVDT